MDVFKNKILITGAGGQVGCELVDLCKEKQLNYVAYTSSELDITDEVKVLSEINKQTPSVVINAAAYTAVDKAEEHRYQAFSVNEKGSKNIAEACKKNNVRLIHISTDFVFDGSQSRPYKPLDKPSPLGVYGESKLAGEHAVQNILSDNYSIIRTGWVYSSYGNNFVKTMLRLMNERDSLSVVVDQVGTPTYAKGLAEFIFSLLQLDDLPALLHWSDAGVCSWYDFAVAIQQLGKKYQLLTSSSGIIPIPASNYPTPAQRPAFSILDKNDAYNIPGVKVFHWQLQLEKMICLVKDAAQ